MTAWEIVQGVVLVLILGIGKKLWYKFIERKYPDVPWDKD